ncbi:MAG: hypothetical protein ACK5LP_05200 [Campylobacteraceae bacterium]
MQVLTEHKAKKLLSYFFDSVNFGSHSYLESTEPEYIVRRIDEYFAQYMNRLSYSVILLDNKEDIVILSHEHKPLLSFKYTPIN